MSAAPYIVVDRVCKAFGAQPVLRDVSTQFRTGEVSVIIGASGSGKSTLLRAINRLEPHDSGTITIAGVAVGPNEATLQQQRTDVGMVFQQFNLFGHMTVLDNLTLAPRRIHRTPRAQA
ncbi:MAG: ATP-binding cassette domain-containing protein, partial [Comamonas sp.]